MLPEVLKILDNYLEITLFYKKKHDKAGKRGPKSKKITLDNK